MNKKYDKVEGNVLKKRYLQSWAILFLVLTVVSACSSEEEKEYHEDARVYISSAIYDEEANLYTIEYQSNINFDLEYTAILYNAKNQVIERRENVTIEKQTGAIWRTDEIKFAPQKNVINEEVFLELVIEVDMNVKNDELIYDSPENVAVVGYGESLTEHYKDSNDVLIEAESSTKYTMTLKSKPEPVEKHSFLDSSEDEEVALISYSNEFLDYNEKYYTHYKNKMDLIADHFELLSVEGFRNQDIVDDLLTWTSEFDELLDVYETNSVPINEADHELYAHTIEMISEQRIVNENVIQGLNLRDANYFSIAGNHLANVTEMYLNGYNLLYLN